MTKEELAALLNGREYGEEITEGEEAKARASGLLVIFGYSDDNVEFRGFEHDESGARDGTTFYFSREGIIGDPEREECRQCSRALLEKCKGGAQVKARWCPDEIYSWTFETKIPHATFDIVEGAEKFCRGIVIDSKDLPFLANASFINSLATMSFTAEEAEALCQQIKGRVR